MTLGERLKKLREEQNMSQPKLAEEVGVTKQLISKYEKGMQYPSVPTLTALAEVLNCTTDYLCGRE